MVGSRWHGLGRRAVVVLSVVVTLVALGGPARADSDGYMDNFSGDAIFKLAKWDQNASSYVPTGLTTTVKGGDPGGIRNAFDTAWTTARDSFCAKLEAGIKQGDSSFVKTNRCTPLLAIDGELRARNLGTNLLGLRYVLPGAKCGRQGDPPGPPDGICYAF